jgi:hypothetical protein
LKEVEQGLGKKKVKKRKEKKKKRSGAGLPANQGATKQQQEPIRRRSLPKGSSLEQSISSRMYNLLAFVGIFTRIINLYI